MPASPFDVVKPAFQHTIQQLFKPFRFSQWARLAVTGFLAGEMSNAGGCGVQFPYMPRVRNGPQQFAAFQGIPQRGLLTMIGIVLLVVIGLALMIGLVYISSRMRFVLFDSIVNKECRIRQYWSQRGEQALRYFGFQLLFGLSTITGIALIAGLGLTIAFAFGWLRNPRAHLAPLIVGGVLLALLVAAFVIAATVVSVLTKDFVVPQMALENVTVVEGWRRLQAMLSSAKGSYAGYIGMKVVLSIAGTALLAMAALITVVILLIPTGVIALIAVFGGRAIGLVWNPITIAIAIVAGSIAVAIAICAVALVSVPVIVFFPAYAVHFLAPRYEPLSRLV